MHSRLIKTNGLYLITPDRISTERLCAQLKPLLQLPIALMQYRSKCTDTELKQEQATAVLQLCRAAGLPLLINDDWQLAKYIDADGVHLGEHDGDPVAVRQQLGAHKIIGVSCYNDLQRAEMLSQCDVDYLAFGALFPSPSKPNARQAPLAVLREARKLQKPIVAIGGISPDNSALVQQAGADLIAVISGVFNQADPVQAAQTYIHSLSKATS